MKDKSFVMLKTEEVELGEGKAKYIQVLGKGKKYNTTKGNHKTAIYDDLLSVIKKKEYKNLSILF